MPSRMQTAALNKVLYLGHRHHLDPETERSSRLLNYYSTVI